MGDAMTKRAAFTQAQVVRAIAAAKRAGLRIFGIRPDGTVIVHDADGPVEDALRVALGCKAELEAVSPWDDVSAVDEWKPQVELRAPHVAASGKIPLTPKLRRDRVEKWKDWVRGRPLGVLEKRALKELFLMKGQPPRHIKGAGPGTMDKLKARGFVRPVGEIKPGHFSMYEVTKKGAEEWLKICDEAF